MNWDKIKIDPTQLEQLYKTYTRAVKEGKDNLEDYYCIWKYKDTKLIHFYPLFQFLDKYESIIHWVLPIEEFYLCRPK